MFGNRLIKSNNAGAACTTDTVQILDGVPLESIATYQLDGAATSIPNNTYPGTANNITYAAGKFGQAAVFNGSSSIIKSASLGTQFRGQTTLSISAWFNTSSSGRLTIVSFSNTGDASTDTWLGFVDGINTIGFRSISNGSNVLQWDNSGGSNLRDGNWHNVVLTADSSGTRLYVDNSELTGFAYVNGSSSTNIAMPSDLNQFAIGANTDDGGNQWFMNGSIDQVRIFDTALSAGAVTSLYNETVATASNSYINVPSCIAYYKMSDATDETGSYDGTPTNVNFNVAGKFGNAGDFNGSSSKIDLSNLGLGGSSERSVSFWVNPSVTARGLVFCSGTGSNGQGFTIDVSSVNKIRVSYYNRDFETVGTAPNNTWSNIVVTYNGGVVQTASNTKVYINGTLQTLTSTGGTYTGVANTSDSNYSLGYRRYTNSLYLNGKIDQVRIFNRAITANEVTTLYDEVQCTPTIVPTDNFNTVLYPGNDTGQSIAGVGFQPDFTWIKDRDTNYAHQLYDTVRGATEKLHSNTTAAEATDSTGLTSFDTNGFTVSTNVGINTNNNDYVAWNWKAGGSAGTYNIDGTGYATLGAAGLSITGVNGNSPTFTGCSINTEAGFGIYQIDPDAAAANQRTDFTHGLDSTPELVISKILDGSGGNWHTFTNIIDGSTDRGKLNTSDAFVDDTLNGVSIATSTEIRIEEAFTGGTSSFLLYAFHSVDGYSKIGSYTGNRPTDVVIYTGFAPRFVMIKCDASGESWTIVDSARGDNLLHPNTSSAEEAYTGVSLTSTGFTVHNSGLSNTNGATHIYLAFAEEVFVPDNFFNDDSTVATYKLDGDLGDDSGKSVPLQSASSTYGSGVFDQALYLTGGQTASQTSTSYGAMNITGSYTMSCYFKATTGGKRNIIWYVDNIGGVSSIVEFGSDNKLYFGYAGPSGAFVSSSTYSANVWYHLAVSVNASTGAIVGYVNGQSIGSGTGNTSTGSTQCFGHGAVGLTGYIDQVRIFDRILDSGEVTQLYNE